MNIDAIRQHYRFLNHEKETEIRIFSEQQQGERYSYFVRTENDFVNTILQIGPDKSIGVGIHERKPECNTDDDVIALKYLPIDIDSKDIVESFEQLLKDCNIQIAAKVFSGQKGYHYYIKTTTINDNIKIREFLENAKYFFGPTKKSGVDIKCFNPSRILRVWGTINKGSEVKIEFINNNAESITEDFFPERPYYEKTNRKFLGKHQVIPRVKFIEDLLNKKIQLPLKENTSFNDSFMPNIICYAINKNISLLALYEIAKNKRHSKLEIDGWKDKADKLIFNYAQLRLNVKTHYEELYKEYFLKESQDNINNLSYTQSNETTQSNYKELHRSKEYYTVADCYTIKGKIIVQPQCIEQIHIGLKYYKNQESELDPKTPFIIFYDEFVNTYKSAALTKKQCEAYDLEFGTHYSLKSNMFVYDVFAENDSIYKVFSEQPIENGDYIFHGTRFDIRDKAALYKSTKQTVDAKVLFLHSFENNKKIYKDFNECYAAIPYSIDDFYRYLMSNNKECYLTSDFFKKIYLAWFFSGRDKDGRPLNLTILGESGSGKTPQLHAITSKFGENENSGTKLTINGLIISFFGNTPKPGEFLKSNRIIAIDEFFKMLSNRSLESYDDLANLNDMLDNLKKNIPNGKVDISVQAKCQLLASSNPIHERFTGSRTIGKRLNFMRMCEILPSDFMGRILYAIQTDEEYKQLKSGKMILKNFKSVDIHKDEFLALYDFFNTINIELTDNQTEQLLRILNEVALPDSFKHVYDKSCSRNAELLLFGIAKTRMFATKSTSISITDEDIQIFDSLWKELHYRWFTKTDISVDPIKFLSDAEKDVLLNLQNIKEVTYYMAGQSGHIDTLNKLADMDLIKKDHENKKYIIKEWMEE